MAVWGVRKGAGHGVGRGHLSDAKGVLVRDVQVELAAEEGQVLRRDAAAARVVD